MVYKKKRLLLIYKKAKQTCAYCTLLEQNMSRTCAYIQVVCNFWGQCEHQQTEKLLTLQTIKMGKPKTKQSRQLKNK